MTSGLSAQLRQGTARAHRRAEGGAFVQGLLRGAVDRDLYRQFLQGLREVYGSLEAGLIDNRADPRLAPLVRPEVFRVPALDADLAYFHGPPIPRLAAAARYGAHLEQLARRTPELLVAHAYTRTLGDLSGGQLLRRSLQQALGLGSEGCAFFAFPAIAELGAYKADYRATLDALPLDGPTRARIVVEAQLAFELNEALTRELASPVPLAG